MSNSVSRDSFGALVALMRPHTRLESNLGWLSFLKRTLRAKQIYLTLEVKAFIDKTQNRQHSHKGLSIPEGVGGDV